jgi:hypothetical protein
VSAHLSAAGDTGRAFVSSSLGIVGAWRLTRSSGELQARPGPYRSPVPPEAADAVLELLRDGTYAAAVARVVAEDPDLADE